MSQSIEKKRTSRGRSRNGCQNCRLRRIKCDEQIPSCQNCMKGGRDCIRPGLASSDDLNPSFASLIPVRGTPAERELFHRYEHRIAPIAGSLMHQAFWSKTVLAAAQEDGGIWNAILALSAIMEAPSLEAQGISTSQNQKKALTWYGRSIGMTAQAITKNNNTNQTQALVSSMLFFFIEREQKHRKNAQRLLSIAFSIVRGMDKVEDSTTAMCLPVLLDSLAASLIDSTCVPQDHSEHVCKQALKWASKSVYPKLFTLRIQLFALMHECQTFLFRNLKREDYEDVLSRLQEWWQNLQNYSAEQEAKLPHIEARVRGIRTVFRMTWIQLRAELKDTLLFLPDEKQLVILLDEFEEAIMGISEFRSEVIPSAMEGSVMPTIIFLAWHLYSQEVLERLVQILVRLEKYCTPAMYQAAFSFVSNVASTGQNTREDTAKSIQNYRSTTPAMWKYFEAAACLVTRSLPAEMTRENILAWMEEEDEDEELSYPA